MWSNNEVHELIWENLGQVRKLSSGRVFRSPRLPAALAEVAARFCYFAGSTIPSCYALRCLSFIGRLYMLYEAIPMGCPLPGDGSYF